MNKIEIALRYVFAAIIAGGFTYIAMMNTYAYVFINQNGEYVSTEEYNPDTSAIVSNDPVDPIKTEEEIREELDRNNQVISSPYLNVFNSMTSAERDELIKIVAAESQTQDIIGRRAVVEVIFNRVNSPEWPKTVYGVLSQKGQFATWRLRNNLWVEPKYGDEAVNEVQNKTDCILPNKNYVFFSTRKGSWGKNWIKIGDHYFGEGR